MTVEDCLVIENNQEDVLDLDKQVELKVETQETKGNLRKVNEMQVHRKLFQQEAPTYAWKNEEFYVRKQQECDQKKMQGKCDASPRPIKNTICDDAARTIGSMSAGKVVRRKDSNFKLKNSTVATKRFFVNILHLQENC